MDDDQNIDEVMKLGPHVVPGVWKAMLPAELQHMRIPSECRSTCSDCPQVKEAGFHPDYRCCTYHPRIPNFLLGFGLDDETTAPHFLKVIADGLATPEGLHATPSQFRHSLEHVANVPPGNQVDLVCRFLDAKLRRCNIYRYRNSVCSTFFCKHDDPVNGPEFWEKLQALAGQVETALGQWAMGKLGIGSENYFARLDALAQELSHVEGEAGGWAIEAQKKLWGDWFGRERDFFVQCAQLVRDHQETLYEIAEKVMLRSAHQFDAAFRASLTRPLQEQYDLECPMGSEPASMSDLWYALQLSHRNLVRGRG